MEAYNTNEGVAQESKFFVAYEKTKSWVTATLGLIVTLLAIGVIFVVASLEGTKEVKASNSDSAKILQIWRTENNSETYPAEKADIIKYEGKEYYFIIDKFNEETNEIVKWHFAYDGGIDYVYKDVKFWVLTALSVAVAIFITQINYVSASKNAMETDKFKRTLKHYQGKKETIEPYTQYIPAFCIYKNNQTYNIAKREIIEGAGINYKLYETGKIKKDELEKWQRKELRRIRKIKVKRIGSPDLLQEKGYSSTKISLLPKSLEEHQRSFLIKGAIQKVATSILSGFVVSFGVVLGNWYLGIVYGLIILISAVVAVVIATEFVLTTLRNRYIGKADLLNEFNNIKERFIKEDEELTKKQDIDSTKTNDAVV